MHWPGFPEADGSKVFQIQFVSLNIAEIGGRFKEWKTSLIQPGSIVHGKGNFFAQSVYQKE
jgi:hypothetical protein